MKRLLTLLQRCLGATTPRRYRVTPRQNPFALRREMRRDIRRLLRQANWAGPDTRP